jgi:hypothetical protein
VVARFSGGIHLDGNFNTVAQMTSQQNTASQQNSGTGIVLSGDFGNLITGSVATGNDSEGIHGGGNGFATSVSDSVASNNGNFGIISIGGVSDSVANNNGGYGIVAQDGLVTGSTARGNALIGIMVENADYGSVVDSNALGNGGDGIVSSGNVISSTAIDNGDRGIVLSCPVSAFGNRAINNPGGKSRAIGQYLRPFGQQSALRRPLTSARPIMPCQKRPSRGARGRCAHPLRRRALLLSPVVFAEGRL